MADNYQFSQSSIQLVNRCIAVASQSDEKWTKLFPPRPISPENASSEDDEDDISLSDAESVENVEVIAKQDSEPVEVNLEDIKKIAAVLESMPTNSNKLDFLTAQTNYEQMLPKLAGNLTSACLEIICENTLKSYAVQNEKILLHFLPVYITREPCSTTLRLFLMCSKMYPDTIVTISQYLFMNMEIPSKQLEELFKAVDDRTRNQFLQAISVTNVPADVFVHNLNLISYLHKNCKKTFENQNFVLKGLQQSSNICRDDKNWRQCMLVFIQGLKEANLCKVTKQTLEQLLTVHNTMPMKRCELILRSLYKQ